MVEARKIGITGNSAKVTIPIHYLRELGWEAGDIVEIIKTDSGIMIKKLDRGAK